MTMFLPVDMKQTLYKCKEILLRLPSQPAYWDIFSYSTPQNSTKCLKIVKLILEIDLR